MSDIDRVLSGRFSILWLGEVSAQRKNNNTSCRPNRDLVEISPTANQRSVSFLPSSKNPAEPHLRST